MLRPLEKISMAENSENQGTFDRMLRATLRQHREPVPPDFTEKMLQQVRQAEARKMLSEVLWQERLALAMSIILGCVAIIGALFFPGRIVVMLKRISASLTGYGGRLTQGVHQVVDAVGGEWQFYAVLGVVLAFATYCLIDLFAGDRLRTM